MDKIKIVRKHPKLTLSFIVLVVLFTLFLQSLLSENEFRCEEKCKIKNKKYQYTPPSIDGIGGYVKDLCKCI